MKSKKIYMFAIIMFMSSFAHSQFSHQNISLLGQFNDTTVVAESVYGIRYQSCWGWQNPLDQKEYAIIGSTAGTYIIDVSIPTAPTQINYIPHRQTDCIWHEYKTYGNYLYIISDDAGNNSLQIVDLSTLPISATVIYDSNSIFTHAHAQYVDGNKLYVSSVNASGNYSSMNVYSLNDPTFPTLLRRLDSDFPSINSVHDMYVVNDTVYASCGNSGLYIFHYDTIANHFILLGSLTNFPTQRYNHSSFLSPDHGYLYMCDEVPSGMPFSVVDVRDISNPTVIGTYNTNVGATPHNPYVKDNLLFVAAYQDGLYIYDISNPITPVLSGYFDTHPQNPPGTYPSPAYAGCWAAYTDLPSGIILASDMQLGLFILDVSVITSSKTFTQNSNDKFIVYPNPSNNQFSIRIKNENESGTMTLYDLNGRTILLKKFSNQSELTFETNNISNGVYSLNIQTEKINFTNRINIVH